MNTYAVMKWLDTTGDEYQLVFNVKTERAKLLLNIDHMITLEQEFKIVYMEVVQLTDD